MDSFLKELLIGIVIIVGVVILATFIALPGWLLPLVAGIVVVYLVVRFIQSF